MALAQSFYNQSSALRTNVMVVDDDPVFLQIMSRMLEKSEYRAIMEITVIGVKDSREALSTLKIQRNNIDLIITEYYMHGMNGLQLKKQINLEIGDLPVIVMSSDTNKEQESLNCGAICFIPKPFTATDVTKIYQLAFTYKRKGKSTLWTEHNHNDTYVSIPQQIELLPEQENFMKTKKKKFSPRSDSRSVNILNGSCGSTDDSRKHQKISDGGSGNDVESLSQPSKKKKVMWTDDLHDLFLQAIRHIGFDKAVPKKILEFMNVSDLTRENVASHLQKYRKFLRKVTEKTFSCSSMLPDSGIDSIYPYNNKTLSSYGSLIPNPPGISSYASLTSTQPGMISHGSLVLNQPGMSRYESSTSTQPEMASHGSFNPNKLGINIYGSLTSTQPGMSSYGILTSNKLVMSSHGSLSPNQPGMRNYENLTPNQLGLSSHESLTPNHSELNSYESVTHSARLNSYERLTPHQPGSCNFSYGLQSLNNESTAYNPQPHANATTQPNLGVPQSEDLSLYDELGITNELLCDISNFQFDHNKGHSNGETSNNFSLEMNSQIFNMSNKHDEEQDVPGFVDWSSLNPEDLANEYDFMDSLFTSDVN